MVKSKNSKRVSWAADVNLRQVRLFLSEDSPSQVGLGGQDHLQVKTAWLVHSFVAGSDDHLPPGFDSAHSSNELEIEVCQIPLIKWQSPPKFVLTPDWHVVAGEESSEAEIQKQREMTVLEAVYPRPSCIPTSPQFPVELEDSQYDDRRVLVIPITPIEDEEATDPSSSGGMQSINIPTSSHLSVSPQRKLAPAIVQTSHSSDIRTIYEVPTNKKPAIGSVSHVQPDVVAAASAAFTAIMRSNDPGSMVDPELLVRILNNPIMIEKLLTGYSPANLQSVPKPSSSAMNLPPSSPFPVHMNRIEPKSPVSIAPNTSHFQSITTAAAASTLGLPPSSGYSQVPAQTVKAPPVKDINYYKSLIQQHGGERSDNQEQTTPQFSNHRSYQPSGNNLELHSSKSMPKVNKPCLYFNSSRGCKRGSYCAYLHDDSVQQPEAQSAKRMKLDREITGRS